MTRIDALIQLLEEIRKRRPPMTWWQKLFVYPFPAATVQTPLNFSLSGQSNNAAVLNLLGIHDSKGYEPVESFLALVLTQRGGTFFDIGANIGYFSLLTACNTERPLTVHAFEPVSANFQFLVENIRQNRKASVIRPYQIALGDEDSVLEISKYGTGSSLLRGWDGGEGEKHGLEKVQVKTLDSLFPPAGLVSPIVVKMDVEGYEASVIRGAEQLIRSPGTTCVLLECGHNLFPGGRNPEAADTLRKLQTWGYECYGIKSSFVPSDDPQEESLIPFHEFDPENLEGWASSWVCVRRGHPMENVLLSSLELYPVFYWTYRRRHSDLKTLLEEKR